MNITLRQNIDNMAISQYANFFFDRGMTKVGGKKIALRCDALCQLGGDNDAGTNIDAEAQTGVTAFGDGDKRVRSFHFKGQYDGPSSITAKYAMDSFTPDQSGTAAATSAVGSSGSGSLKFNGLRTSHGEHLSVLISNVNGAKFFINQIVAFLVNRTRR